MCSRDNPVQTPQTGGATRTLQPSKPPGQHRVK